MSVAVEIILSILGIVILVCTYMAGYSFGRADGIEWARDVYNGKHDKKIESWHKKRNVPKS
jgi:hypothetical protein